MMSKGQKAITDYLKDRFTEYSDDEETKSKLCAAMTAFELGEDALTDKAKEKCHSIRKELDLKAMARDALTKGGWATTMNALYGGKL